MTEPKRHSPSASTRVLTPTQTLRETEAHVICHRKAPYLVLYTGDNAGKRFEVREETMTIGRSAEAAIVLDDERISRIHCAVTRTPQEIVIEDRQSKNGTFLDGQRIERDVLKSSATIQIGHSLLKLEYKDKSEIDFEDGLFRKAMTDPLTGIPNRQYFMRRAAEELPMVRRSGGAIALIMMDLDGFKNVNDRQGHQAGDYVLCQVATLINANKREEDLLARYGGDEFIVMLRGQMGPKGALDFCERCRLAVARFHFEFDGQSLPLTISMGLCQVAGATGLEFDALIARADRALYRAKQDGRNCVRQAEG